MKLAAVLVVVLAFGGLVAGHAIHSGEAGSPYPRMAPTEDYLMPDRNEEIDLARTGAPEAISRDATVMILGRHGFETAAQGKNGFVCIVERSWNAPLDDPEFWNAKIRAPICFNPQAARSLLLALSTQRAELAMAGMSLPEIATRVHAALRNHELPELEAGSMCYMMSKRAYLGDEGSHNLAHLMLYAPPMDPANWGAGLLNSPVIYGSQSPPEPYTEFIVTVGKWSDGTPAPLVQ
ncbi:MAG TPA: hypothetical protein VF753_18580 [Terriglobales bacterium]